MAREFSLSTKLARLGFQEPSAAAEILASWNLDSTPLWPAFAKTADPDLALEQLAKLYECRPDLFQDFETLKKIILIAGFSEALGQYLLRHPEAISVLSCEPLANTEFSLVDKQGLDNGEVERLVPIARVNSRNINNQDANHGFVNSEATDNRYLDSQRTEPREPSNSEILPATKAEMTKRLLDAIQAQDGTANPQNSDQLRIAYHREILRIAYRDLSAPDPLAVVESISAELSDLADAVVTAALALAKGETSDWEKIRFGVLALGKCGARELNYVSDVDVLFVAEPDDPETSDSEAIQIANKLAAALIRITSAYTAAGTIWPLDAALRPEGKAGVLVRTLSGMESYYRQWAKNWEFQALLKARPMAGDLALAQDFVDLVAPKVWSVGEQPNFVSEVREMRKRVVSLIPAKEIGREIKLGSGGLRDVEFTVQLLQLVHGRADQRLRYRGTFPALKSLVDYGYVGRDSGFTLAQEYRFQRVLEHRVQLFHLRRTHLLPNDAVGQLRLARAFRQDWKTLEKTWQRSTRKVLELHQQMFYSPLLEAISQVPAKSAALSQDAAKTWMRALGFADPKAAFVHIETLSHGFSRAAEIQRQLLPVMLSWFAEGPNPDLGLLSFRQVSEAMGNTSWYLRTLRDGGAMAQDFATVLSASRYVVDLLLRAPQAVSMLAEDDGTQPRTRAEILAEMQSMTKRHEDTESAISAVRAVRRYELLRLAMADILGKIEIEDLGPALSDITSATITAALKIAARETPEAPEIGVVAMGRWGGKELSYASDADVIFVIADTEHQEDLRKANAVVAKMRALLAAPGPDPALQIDADLRPEGKSGPLVRTLSSALKYYQNWSDTWEAQALLRADYGAGNSDIVAGFLAGIAFLRYPEAGLADKQVNEIRKLKARMEAERMPKGVVPSAHLKLGPGGLSDVEWTIQLLQLQFAAKYPQLQTPQTLAAISAALCQGLLSEDQAKDLKEAWTLASRIRNATLILRGRGSDLFPADLELAAVAKLLGYQPGEVSQLSDDYRRFARRSRAVMEKIFWA